MCRLIEFHGFDIFGSQEVLDGQLHDMLAQLPDYDYIGVGRDDGKTQGEYAPVFYKKERFRLLDEGHFWLSEITDRPNKGWDAALPRICTWGHFLDLQTKRRFWFFNRIWTISGCRPVRRAPSLWWRRSVKCANPKSS